MNIKKWPSSERPREKLLTLGPQNLSDAELIAIFIHTGIKNKSAVTIAREILLQSGTLRNLLNTELNEFCKIPGLGKAKYALLQAALEISRRYLYEKIVKANVLSNPDDVRYFLIAKLRDRPLEIFACLFLDNKNRCITYEEITYGTIDFAMVYPRELIKRILFHNATAVIFAHNHPSGLAEPSQSDIELTQRLNKTLACIDIRLLDHFIIGDGKIVSLAELGHIIP